MTDRQKSGDFNDQYEKLLREAETANLSRVLKSGCVSIGRDLQGYPAISFIPSMGFDYGDKSEETLHQIYLLFVKMAHSIVTSGPYSVVYSRKSVDWRKPLIYDYYEMLPEKAKKNLVKLYVINPQIGMRMFFAITRVFLSAEFYKKLVFVENIAEFQRIVPPKLLILPYNFLRNEDAERGLKCSGVSVPLTLDYVPIFGTTSIMKRCTRFLRQSGGLKKVGLFRVAGNENQLSLVRVRLQPPIYFTKNQMRAYMNSIIVGLDDDDYRANERNGMSLKRNPNKKNDAAQADEDITFNLSTVVITDVESVAQTLKLSLRDLPEPLFTFKAFDVLMRITQILDRKQMTIDAWHEQAAEVIKSMPVEHRSTLCYLLDFLREVAAESTSNQMDIHNLSTIFAPTLLRPAKPDFTNPAKAFNEVRLCQLVIKFLLERRIFGVSTLMENTRDHDIPSGTTSSDFSFGVDAEDMKPSIITPIQRGDDGSKEDDSFSSISIEAHLNSKMKNRVTSYARPNRVANEKEIKFILSQSSVDDSGPISLLNSQLKSTSTISRTRRLSDSSITSQTRLSAHEGSYSPSRPQSSSSVASFPTGMHKMDDNDSSQSPTATPRTNLESEALQDNKPN